MSGEEMEQMKQIATRLAERTNISGSDAEKFIAAMVEVFSQELEDPYGKIVLPGLGTFRTEFEPRREATHPKVGKIVTPEKKWVKFKPSKELLETVGGIPARSPGLSGFLSKIFQGRNR